MDHYHQNYSSAFYTFCAFVVERNIKIFICVNKYHKLHYLYIEFNAMNFIYIYVCLYKHVEVMQITFLGYPSTSTNKLRFHLVLETLVSVAVVTPGLFEFKLLSFYSISLE